MTAGSSCDVADGASVEYLLHSDTLSGRFPDPVPSKDGKLLVRGKSTPFVTGWEKGAIPELKVPQSSPVFA